MQTEKFQLEGKRIMPENSVNLVSGIIRLPSSCDFSVCIGNRCLIIFLPMTLNIVIYYPSFHSFLEILRRITPFSGRHSVIFAEVQK